jgi:peptide/nickel transport system substrate-binding protein
MSNNKSDILAMLSHAERERLIAAVRHGTSRRDMLGFLSALGIGAGFGGALIGAATTAHAQAPKRGGKIRVAGFGSSTADTLDPAKQSYSTDYCRCTMFYNGLTELDETMNPKLALAESIENDKATVWTIKLRKGVQFHNGKELNAEDVVFTLKRHHEGESAGRPDERDRRHRDARSQNHAVRPQRRLPGCAGHLSFPDRARRHH